MRFKAVRGCEYTTNNPKFTFHSDFSRRSLRSPFRISQQTNAVLRAGIAIKDFDILQALAARQAILRRGRGGPP